MAYFILRMKKQRSKNSIMGDLKARALAQKGRSIAGLKR